jgi:hypothetical protein
MNAIGQPIWGYGTISGRINRLMLICVISLCLSISLRAEDAPQGISITKDGGSLTVYFHDISLHEAISFVGSKTNRKYVIGQSADAALASNRKLNYRAQNCSDWDDVMIGLVFSHGLAFDLKNRDLPAVIEAYQTK